MALLASRGRAFLDVLLGAAVRGVRLLRRHVRAGADLGMAARSGRFSGSICCYGVQAAGRRWSVVGGAVGALVLHGEGWRGGLLGSTGWMVKVAGES